ncbi:MAG TPA: hypothetical protein DGG22_06635 [Ruminococcaceae bacterium]|nr:hypothetical protein [Oscillospiraceae bacterium]
MAVKLCNSSERKRIKTVNGELSTACNKVAVFKDITSVVIRYGNFMGTRDYSFKLCFTDFTCLGENAKLHGEYEQNRQQHTASLFHETTSLKILKIKIRQ